MSLLIETPKIHQNQIVQNLFIRDWLLMVGCLLGYVSGDVSDHVSGDMSLDFFSSRKTQADLILTTGSFATIRKAPEISSTNSVLPWSSIPDASKRLHSESMHFVSPAGKFFRSEKQIVRSRKVHHREEHESDDNFNDSDF